MLHHTVDGVEPLEDSTSSLPISRTPHSSSHLPQAGPLLRHAHFKFSPVVSGEDTSWRGAKGLVHEEAIRQLEKLTEHDFYLSGSEGMVMAVYKDLVDRGVDKSQIYSDMLDIKRDMGDEV